MTMQGIPMVKAPQALTKAKKTRKSQRFSRMMLAKMWFMHFLWSFPTLKSRTTIIVAKKSTKQKALEVPVKMFKMNTIRIGKQKVSNSSFFLASCTGTGSSSSTLVAFMSLMSLSNQMLLPSSSFSSFFLGGGSWGLSPQPSLYLLPGSSPSSPSTGSILFLTRFMIEMTAKTVKARKVKKMVPLWQFWVTEFPIQI